MTHNKEPQIESVEDVMESLEIAMLRKDNKILIETIDNIINAITSGMFKFKHDNHGTKVLKEVMKKIDHMPKEEYDRLYSESKDIND